MNENVTFEKNLKVKDNAKANIILCEGKKMRCKDNFTVNETSELTIWGQKETSGELESSGGYFSAYAAIGGAEDHTNGLIEIHSGNVVAHLGGSILFNRGAAIGAGNGADGGVIRILGGKVHAYTEGAGTGIGGGNGANGCHIVIRGGDITAKGGSSNMITLYTTNGGAGIGGGVYPNTITQLLPKTDHEWGAADYTWMDDNHRVLAKRQCQLEPSHFETEVAQTSSEVIREATCTEAGTTKYTADFANEAFSQQIKEEADIPALGHDWGEWMETTPATEDTAGEEARACSRCPETQTRSIPPKDHRHGLRHIAAKAATCTENGWAEYYVCDRGDHPCGRYYADPEGEQSIDDPFIPALGHNYQVKWEWSDDNTSAALSYVCLNDEADAGTVTADVRVEETPATCEKAGKKLYTATVAKGPGEKTYTDVREAETSASGHKWGDWKNFDADQHQRVCSNDPSHIEKENHNWDEGKVTVYPTVIREGMKTYTCQSCQTTRTEVIPKITPETPVPFTDGMVTLDAETFVYNGSVQKPEVQVAYAGETLDPGSYSVTCSDENSTDAGEYTVTVKMGKDSCFTDDPVTKTYIIEKAANTMTVKAAAKKVKLKKVKKKNQTVTALTVKGRQGKVTYKGTPVGKKAKKALKINAKTGKITVKKKTKKGTYKMKVTVTAAGNDNYNAKAQTVTVKIRVK